MVQNKNRVRVRIKVMVRVTVWLPEIQSLNMGVFVFLLAMMPTSLSLVHSKPVFIVCMSYRLLFVNFDYSSFGSMQGFVFEMPTIISD